MPTSTVRVVSALSSCNRNQLYRALLLRCLVNNKKVASPTLSWQPSTYIHKLCWGCRWNRSWIDWNKRSVH